MNTFFKLLIFIYSLKSFLRRKVFIKNIKKGDLVLDIGSGDKPLWRADVIVDKYLKDDGQRNSGSILFDNKKIFIQADVEELPFKNKAFDFVYCSHLLEHVKNPDKAITELTRVAKKGYIEVPNAIVDLLQPFPSHLWFCDYQDGVLIFRQKEKNKNFYIQNTEKFGKVYFNNNLFQYLLAKFYKSIFITLYWKDNLDYKVQRVKKYYIYKPLEDKEEKKGTIKNLTYFLYKIYYTFLTMSFYRAKKIDMEKLMK